jgi:hypothetical protein
MKLANMAESSLALASMNVMLLLVIAIAATQGQQAQKPPDHAQAHSDGPVHSDEIRSMKELMNNPRPEPLPTSGCKPVYSGFENSCSVLADHSCPAGHQLRDVCSFGGSPTIDLTSCGSYCLLDKDAAHLDHLRATCKPSQLGCVILSSGRCPPDFKLVYSGHGVTDSKGVSWGTVCKAAHPRRDHDSK